MQTVTLSVPAKHTDSNAGESKTLAAAQALALPQPVVGTVLPGGPMTLPCTVHPPAGANICPAWADQRHPHARDLASPHCSPALQHREPCGTARHRGSAPPPCHAGDVPPPVSPRGSPRASPTPHWQGHDPCSPSPGGASSSQAEVGARRGLHCRSPRSCCSSWCRGLTARGQTGAQGAGAKPRAQSSWPGPASPGTTLLPSPRPSEMKQ